MESKSFLIATIVLINGFCCASNYQSMQDFIDHSTIDGNFRLYQYNRFQSASTQTNQRAFSLGGSLRVVTAPIHGLSAGLTYFAANSLGFNSSNLAYVDATLPGNSVNVLGEEYLQYQNPAFLFRGGAQIIKTPWVNDSDSRMIPVTYRGLYSVLTPVSGLELTAMRLYSFKNRTTRKLGIISSTILRI